jgi:glycosyltransferase involved in cell wall biosynthesis
MKKEKVLHIVTVSFVINHFFGSQFLYLSSKTGNEYHLGCSRDKLFFQLSKHLGYIPFSVEITRSISPFKDLIAIFKVYKYIKQNNINKVVGHTPKGGLVAMIASLIAGVPNRVYFRHGIFYETSTGFRKYLLRTIDRISGSLASIVVCVSNSVKEISERDKLNRSSKNVVLGKGTCNGIDTEIRFNPNKKDLIIIEGLKKKYGISPKDNVVGYVGRLVKDKGIDDLINGWQDVKTKFPHVKLLLVGPLEDRDSISEFSKTQIKTDPSIIHTDFVEDSSIYFSLMDVFVLPTYREGFPTVSLEASSMEIPVLITNATGCSESIIENETGLFISNDPKDIANKIITYLTDKQKAKSHGRMGREFVRLNFEQTKVWDIIEEKLGL